MLYNAVMFYIYFVFPLGAVKLMVYWMCVVSGFIHSRCSKEDINVFIYVVKLLVTTIG
jgi:hypothetical protein